MSVAAGWYCCHPQILSFAHIMEAHKDRPLHIPLVNLRGLPEELWQAVLAVVTTPPVSDFLSVGLTLSLQYPPLPQPVAV
jgi:hypothetical protein